MELEERVAPRDPGSLPRRAQLRDLVETRQELGGTDELVRVELPEGVYHRGVELPARETADLRDRLVNRPRALVGARVRKRIEDVCEGDDSPG